MPRYSTLAVINAAKSLQALPNGTKLNSTQKHTLVTLATYFPHIWPSQSRLASDMSVNRRQVNRRLAELEGMGLVERRFGSPFGTTQYSLNFKVLRPRLRAEPEPDSFDF